MNYGPIKEAIGAERRASASAGDRKVRDRGIIAMRLVIFILGILLVLFPLLPAGIYSGQLLEGLYPSIPNDEQVRGISLSGAPILPAFVVWSAFVSLTRPQHGAPPATPGSFWRVAGWAALTVVPFFIAAGLAAYAQQVIADSVTAHSSGEPIKSPWCTAAVVVEAFALAPMFLGMRAQWRWSRTPSSISVSGLRFGCLGVFLFAGGALITLATASEYSDDRLLLAFGVGTGLTLVSVALAAFVRSGRQILAPQTPSGP